MNIESGTPSAIDFNFGSSYHVFPGKKDGIHDW
jgi:hypothetical protein